MSVWSRIYDRINWKNYPSVQTPINERNLNKMDSALYDMETRVLTLNNNIQGTVTSFNYDEQTGKITVSKFDGSTQVINTNISKIATNWSYNPVTQELIIEMTDGTETRVLLSDLLSPMEIKDSSTIEHFTDATGKVWFNIIRNSITDDMIESGYLSKLQEQADRGSGYVSESETNMNLSVAAKDVSETFSKISESYAHGGTGKREGEDTDNAMYYSEQAHTYQSQVESAILAANEKVEQAEQILNSAIEKVADTVFNVDYATGTLTYTSDAYGWSINENTGNLEWEVL